MPKIPPSLALLTASMFLIAPAFAQAPAKPDTAAVSASAPPTRVDPADARATVAPLIYRSAFEGYRPNAEVQVGAWKDANDQVGRIGGWRAYAKEASQSAASASASRCTCNARHIAWLI